MYLRPLSLCLALLLANTAIASKAPSESSYQRMWRASSFTLLAFHDAATQGTDVTINTDNAQ